MSNSLRTTSHLALWFVALLLRALPVNATPVGAQAPYCCECGTNGPCEEVSGGAPNAGGAPGTRSGNGGTGSVAISLSEGNLRDSYAGPTVMGTNGPTLAFSLKYNSMAADGSQSRTNSGTGYGWTDSYNIFLFSQLGSMFRMDADGRVTKYQLGPGGQFTATAGQFETLIRNPNGTFTLRQKDGTTYDFAFIAGTPFLVQGPVYRLTRITDRNQNVTTLTYSAGMLVAITDTYGRQLSLSYSGNQLIAVTDPLGRATRFFYALNGTLLAKITDPEGDSVQYEYDELAQITRKIDKDGRVFRVTYSSGKPVGIIDGTGSPMLSLSNPGNWATDGTALARDLMRTYVPSTTVDVDGRGNLWRSDYDSNGYLPQIVAPDGATTRYTYDPVTLRVATKTDADGHATTYQYDHQGNVIRKVDALGFVTTFAYEPVFNMMTSMTDANGRVTTYEYDARGNRVRETDPLGGTRRRTYDTHGNVLTDTDKDGHVTVYSYDLLGNRIRITDAVGNAVSMTYDAVGNLVSRTNGRGFTTRYVYDGLNRRVQEVDALGKITETIYDGQGNPIQVVDRNGNATTYHYDQRQRLTRITDTLNQSTTYTYDGNDNRTSVTDKNGHATTFQYDVQNRLVRTTDALSDTTTITYDAVGNKLTETDANGRTTSYQYDVLNRVVRKTDAEGNVTRIGYDGDAVCLAIGCPTRGSSLVTKQIDAEGKVTYFKYDGLDRLVIQNRKQTDTADLIDADDAVTRYTYDAQSNRLTVQEPNGNSTRYSYDALNRRVSTTNAAGDTTFTSYDANSNVKAVTAPNRNVTTNTYDALDRLVQVDDSMGRVGNYTYDPVGNRLTARDGNGNGNTYAYDAVYRIAGMADALGGVARNTYDPVGNLLAAVDREGNVTSYAYDAINRRTRVTDALGNVRQYQYDRVGNMARIVDANNHATNYLYDGINRLVRETYADLRMRTFTYDRVSNLKTRTDQKGQLTTYFYSDLYYLLARTYPVGPTDHMAYDLSGRMLTAERGGWLVTFTYDGANRVTRTTQNGKAINYFYDIPGRTRTLAYPGGRGIVESTDARMRLAAIDDTSSPPPIVRYQYDPGNRVLLRTYRNGTTARYGYNPNNWITALDHSKGATRIAGFGYAFDSEGNKRFEQKVADGANSETRSEAYRYDTAYRLIDYEVGTLVGSTVPVPSTQTQYSLDPVGNWSIKIKDLVPENRVHSVTNEITQIGPVPILSDPDGNTSEDGLYRYTYDEENRLTAVTRKSDSAVVGRYTYDALSRRVLKIANPAGTPTTTGYFYDDARIIEEQNGVGLTQATYLYGNYLDEILTMDRSGQTYYYHQSSLWSVEAITDGTGKVAERYGYDAYGLPSILDAAGTALPSNPWVTPHSAIGNPSMFTGRQLDEEAGLYFYRARYYDAVKGRFVQRDPTGYRSGMNLYEYVRSRPTAQVDPHGLDGAKTYTCKIPAQIEWSYWNTAFHNDPNHKWGVFVPAMNAVPECEGYANAAQELGKYFTIRVVSNRKYCKLENAGLIAAQVNAARAEFVHELQGELVEEAAVTPFLEIFPWEEMLGEVGGRIVPVIPLLITSGRVGYAIGEFQNRLDSIVPDYQCQCTCPCDKLRIGRAATGEPYGLEGEGGFPRETTHVWMNGTWVPHSDPPREPGGR